MLKALDSDGNSIAIDFASPKTAYFCPICNQPLIQKRGEIRQHHFAHIGVHGENSRNYVPCTDGWHYDKTDWHIEWQKRFPVECYERVVSFGGVKHIADILLDDTVIEFQHSNISLDEFNERNEFYTHCGYRVIWVFDMTELFDSTCRRGIFCWGPKPNSYRWMYPRKFFRELEWDFSRRDVTLYFQFDTASSEEENVLERVTWARDFSIFYTDLDHARSIPEFVGLAQNKCSSLLPLEPAPVIMQPVQAKAAGGATIYALWKPEYSGMIVRNLTNGKTMLISGRDGEMYRRGASGQIIGKYSNRTPLGRYVYSDYYVVKDAGEPIWVLVNLFPATSGSNTSRSRPAPVVCSTPSSPVAAPVGDSGFNKPGVQANTTRPDIHSSLLFEQVHTTQTEVENKEKTALDYANEVRDRFNQQETPIRDSRGRRWIQCEKCGRILVDYEFTDYGGRNRVNLGICKECSRNEV